MNRKVPKVVIEVLANVVNLGRVMLKVWFPRVECTLMRVMRIRFVMGLG